MSEKGWYSLTIRKETALKIRELAKNEGLTMDELINMRGCLAYLYAMWGQS